MQTLIAMLTRESLTMRLTMVLGTMLTIIASSWAQAPKSDADSKAQHAHWHEYVSREYGVSFLYPDNYGPTVDERCTDNYYRKYLLCLAPAGGSKQVISDTVIVAVPFHVSPRAGDVMPTRKRIGHHVFYCGVVGSMGVGFSDSCVLNLKGKTLEFQFDPLDGINVTDDTKKVEAAMLKTLRIF
jgi:hypothetical protein